MQVKCKRCRDTGQELLFNWWTECRDCGLSAPNQALFKIVALSELVVNDTFSVLKSYPVKSRVQNGLMGTLCPDDICIYSAEKDPSLIGNDFIAVIIKSGDPDKIGKRLYCYKTSYEVKKSL